MYLSVKFDIFCISASHEDDDSGRSSWSDYQECSSTSSNSIDGTKNQKWPTSFWTQFKVLTQRNFLDAKGRMLSRLNWVQAIGLAIVSGLIWFQVERTEDRLMDIMGWVRKIPINSACYVDVYCYQKQI